MSSAVDDEKHPARDRPRYVVCLPGGGKAAMLFQAGALLALKQLDILQHVKLFSAVGTGCLVQQMLMHARALQSDDVMPDDVSDNNWENASVSKWEQLVIHQTRRKTRTKQTDDPLMTLFVARVLEFACESQELPYIGLKRLFAPSRWLLNPLQQEMTRYWEDKQWTSHKDATMMDHCLSVSAPRNINNREPVFLFSGTQEKDERPICFTNDPNCPSSEHISVVFEGPDADRRLDDVAVACGLPGELGSLSIDGQLIGNASSVDPFGIAAPGYIVIKLKLNGDPNNADENSQNDASRKLLLLDGLSGTNALKAMGPTVGFKVREALEVLMSAPDRRDESMRLHGAHCQLMDTVAAMGVQSPLHTFFLAVKTFSTVRLERMNRHTAQQCINWGYAKAMRCYAPSAREWKPEKLPMSDDDPYGMINALFY